MNQSNLPKKIASELARKLEGFQPSASTRRVGTVAQVADGVVTIRGLPQVRYLEIVSFPGDIRGVAVNLEEDSVGVIVLGQYQGLSQDDEVHATGVLLSVPVGEAFLGRVVNPLGEPLDGKGVIRSKTVYPMEKIAPGVTKRRSVTTPLQTGIKAIDAMIPIGRGQRELIIGDRNTGKTAIAVDTIINQRKEGVICVYVAIGQKTSRIAQVVGDLNRHKAMDHTVIVAASASDPASFQYLAPYAGCAIAEYFMDQGKDVLIVYDDLSKHAWAYRQISLILKRPSGREAYPGDVFYLHSRLLERACRLDEKHGGGSITALPVIETLAGDLSAYIPTNVISITDGQIFLESDLFYAGQRPAVNVGLSVSRVGGSAHIKAMKKVAGNLRLDLAQYRDLAAFAQFSSDLDDATRKQIDRGSRMMEILKQGQYAPMPVEDQIVIVWAGTGGHLDQVPVGRITEFEHEFLAFVREQYPKVLRAIAKDQAIAPETEKTLSTATEEFMKTFIESVRETTQHH